MFKKLSRDMQTTKKRVQIKLIKMKIAIFETMDGVNRLHIAEQKKN